MKFERLAALGALGVCGGLAVLWAGFAWLGNPTEFAGRPGATGGIDSIQRTVLMVAVLVPVAFFGISHVWFASQLFRGRQSITG